MAKPRSPKATEGYRLASGEEMSPKDVAIYIVSMSRELGRLAQSGGFPLLSHLMSLAEKEARYHAGEMSGTPRPAASKHPF